MQTQFSQSTTFAHFTLLFIKIANQKLPVMCCIIKQKYHKLVAQLEECLVTSGYPDGSSSGGPGSNPGENENFWKIPRITRDATTLA